MEHKVCEVAELKAGTPLACVVGLTKIVVVKTDQGEVFALEDKCSHADVRLSGGLVEGCEIECPAHGARFDLRSGKQLCMPAVVPVKRYAARVEGSAVLVALE